MALTDKIRAEVFVRDRAICAFSGRPLWNLDTGPTPFWDMDWVDHIRPAARGGTDRLDNLVCSSSFHNSKKRDNSADTGYMFRCGLPTESYFHVHGTVPARLANGLRRFRALEASDWYFNRAIAHLLIWADDFYWGRRRDRKKRDWCAAAWNKIQSWQQQVDRATYVSFERRSLVRYPRDRPTKLLLELRQVGGLRDVMDVATGLYPYLEANYDAWLYFIEAKSDQRRATILRRSQKNKKIHPHLMGSMRNNRAVLKRFKDICHFESEGIV